MATSRSVVITLVSAVFVLSFAGAISTAWAQTPQHIWSQRFGEAYGQYGNSVAVDDSGNVIVTGDFEDTVDFGGGTLTSAGYYDIFVAKFDAGGNHIWSQRFGDASRDQGYSVAVDGSGNVIVTGDFQGTVDFGGGPLTSAGISDIFVAKFDAGGNHIWSRRFGGTRHQRVYSVAVDGSGNVIVTGDYYGTVDFGGGPLTSARRYDIFVAKFDAGGNHIWSQRFGDADWQFGYGVAVDGSGNVIVTGMFRGTVNFGGGPLTSAGIYDIFVVKFDASGNHVWSQRFGDTDRDKGYSVAVDGSGNVIVTGAFRRTVDFGGGPLTSAGISDIFVAKFDTGGNHIWSQRFGDAINQTGKSVAVAGSGNVIVTGHFQGTVDFGGGPLTCAWNEDIFVAKFDAGGNHIWSQRFGDATYQYGKSVAVAGSGNVIVTGHFQGTVDFGGGMLTSAGGYDVFVAKLGTDTVIAHLDIKPGSCPNPFNTKLSEFAAGSNPRKGGVLPVAVLGSDDFDVTEIDVSTLRLEGVEPVMSGGGPKLEDVATVLADNSDCECTSDGPDGFIDLTMKFLRQEIAVAVRMGTHGEERALTLTGELLDGTPFEATDCVVFVGPPGERELPANQGPTLNMACPNPFNPVTRISYSLPKRQHVHLVIYDVAGRLVDELVNEVKSAGEYLVEWDAGSLPSGIYFYRLRAGSTTLTKKMVLLK